MSELKFIVDHNVGKLARWLRMMGYDSVFFHGDDDSSMVKQALSEGRIVLTRDTGVMRRRAVSSGRVKAILIESEEPEQQMLQLGRVLDLKGLSRPFTLCLECNVPLESRGREEVAGRVPPYVYRTQTQYMECPGCLRIYWRGTHWKAMINRLEKLAPAREN
ncbi:MAG: hypothetical protein A2Y92_00880 [Chloroflexi bacterium RBG_13_57_8]|nr:MAG: hypothetical protein A2Y92_00880 [Chloroflexi bacterium RBG_13_57_8]